MSEFLGSNLIKLLKEIIYVLESDHLCEFIQLDKDDGSLPDEIREAIELLEQRSKP